ncbi:hypothetical protein Cflav_PD0819 [Pedosphaera parvula Ellin514]|uniref:Uncharacterized protein n=1 Tax=Pedosphaera parvula (strain Ellin514) TaxID=320771 RepID=B9XQQ5_PEDPL|nr:hypothetical protein Cflav_PD0819 [Pedosphaera parvula Ellin514]
MAWKTVTPMEEIIRFVMLARSARFTVTELCEQFGISTCREIKHWRSFSITIRNQIKPSFPPVQTLCSTRPQC